MAPRNMELQLFRALLLVATCCFLFASMCSAVTEVGDLNKVYGDLKTGFATKATPMHVTGPAREQFIQMFNQLAPLFTPIADPCKTVLDELARDTAETTVSGDNVDKCGGVAKLFANGTRTLKEFPKTFGTPHVAYQKSSMPKDQFYFGGKDVTAATIWSFKDWFARLDLNEQKKKEWETNTKSEVQTQMLAIKDLSDEDADKGYGYARQMLFDMVESIKATGILMNTARRLAVSVIAIVMSVFAVLF